MSTVLSLLKWVLKAALFFALFAFALNNQQDVTVHFFLGQQWSAPLVVLLLISFSVGVALGVLGMMPHWWKQRRLRQAAKADLGSAASTTRPADSALVAPDGH